MSTIEIKNIGPIETLELSVPENGGLVELRGTHGVGKSTAINAIQTALREDGRLTLRDGADRGSVKLGGANIRVTAARTQHGGELVVESIEGRFSLSDLIDPGIQDPERADAARIKALVELSGATADASLFADLLGSEKVDEKADDLVTLAGKIKAALELRARDAEAAQAREHEKGTREAPPAGATLVGCRAEAEVASELEAAVKALATLEAKSETATKAHERHAAARMRLEAAGVSQLEAATVQARDRQAHAMATVEQRTAEAAELREKLRAAEAALQSATVEASAAVRESKAADAALQAAKALESELSATLPPLVPADELATARARVDACRAESDRQAVLRQHIDQAERAAKHFMERDTFEARAKSLRAMAAKVDDVLSGVVSRMGCALRVRDGRLVMATDRSPGEFFADLSHGERTLAALDVAFSILPTGGVLGIEQEIYGALNDDDKHDIAARAKDKNILVFGAVVTCEDRLSAAVVA